MLKKNAVKFTAKACLKAFKISCYKNTAQCRPICQFNTMPRIIISASVNLTMYCTSMNGSLMAVTLIPFCRQALRTRRPMRPNLHKHTAELFNDTIIKTQYVLYLLFWKMPLIPLHFSAYMEHNRKFHWRTVWFHWAKQGNIYMLLLKCDNIWKVKWIIHVCQVISDG